MTETYSFGAWVRRRRKALALTQDELASRTGCSKELIAKIETDARRPSRQVAALLAAALELASAEHEPFVRAARGALSADQLPAATASVPRPALVVPAPPAPPGGANAVLAPAPLTPLIGRAAEVTELCDLLRAGARLVTLVGPGGIGKTRLAIAATAELLETFADGARFVDLSAVTDPAQAASAISDALGVRGSPGQPAAERLIAFLRQRRLLLALDNFEQVVSATELVAAILTVAPGVAALVTSRVPLHLYGEREIAVAPLALPAPDVVDAARLAQYDALRLFVERAQAVRSDFRLTDANSPAVAEICRRLDGLPLAIELAAAWARVFTPDALLAQLVAQGRLPLLSGGPRNMPARQQTIRNTLTWSYDLLSAEEQALFRALGVFVGGWTLAAAAAVAPQPAMSEELLALVAHSLVRASEGPGGEPRFGMLETVREFALERLHATDDEARLRERHAQWAASHSIVLLDQLWGPAQVAAMAALHAENDNLDAALTWMLANDAASATPLIAQLAWYWYWTAHRRKGVDWIQRALAQSQASGERADLLRMLALLSFDHRLQQARQWIAESLAIARQIGDTGQIADTLRCAAQIEIGGDQSIEVGQGYIRESRALYEQLGDELGIAHCLIFERSPESFERSLALFRRAGHLRGSADVLIHLARAGHQNSDPDRAWGFLTEARDIYRRLGDAGGEVWALLGMGDIAQSTAREDDAIICYQRAQELADLVDDQNGNAWASMNLGELFVRRDEMAAGVPLLRQAIAHFNETKYQYGLAIGLIAGAYIAWSAGEAEQGVRLLAALDQQSLKDDGVPFEEDAPPEHRLFFGFTRARLQEALALERFEQAWNEGSSLSFAEAFAKAARIAA